MSEKSKNILLGVLIVGLVSMTVAYAALSTTLTINGSVSVPNTTWDIHFANWTKADGTDSLPSLVQGQVNTATATAVDSITQQESVAHSTAVSGIAISLKQPGDNIKYEFDIVNDGTIDAKLSGNPVISLTGANNSTVGNAIDTGAVTYNVSCDANQAHLKKATETPHSTHCTLTVKYNEDIENSHTAGTDQTYHTDPVSLTLGASWVYVQE